MDQEATTAIDHGRQERIGSSSVFPQTQAVRSTSSIWLAIAKHSPTTWLFQLHKQGETIKITTVESSLWTKKVQGLQPKGTRAAYNTTIWFVQTNEAHQTLHRYMNMWLWLWVNLAPMPYLHGSDMTALHICPPSLSLYVYIYMGLAKDRVSSTRLLITNFTLQWTSGGVSIIKHTPKPHMFGYIPLYPSVFHCNSVCIPMIVG